VNNIKLDYCKQIKKDKRFDCLTLEQVKALYEDYSSEHCCNWIIFNDTSFKMFKE